MFSMECAKANEITFLKYCKYLLLIFNQISQIVLPNTQKGENMNHERKRGKNNR